MHSILETMLIYGQTELELGKYISTKKDKVSTDDPEIRRMSHTLYECEKKLQDLAIELAKLKEKKTMCSEKPQLEFDKNENNYPQACACTKEEKELYCELGKFCSICAGICQEEIERNG